MKFLLNGLSDINIDEIDIDASKSESIIIFPKFRDKIKYKKEEIDQLENNNIWDKMKKIANPYELIYTTYNKKRKNDSISNYIPISRSYFKLWEIFFNFELLDNKKTNYTFSHLAEGPGGFMEATYNYMKFLGIKNSYYYGITLKPNNEYIPDWNKIKKIFNDYKKINIDYGNLYSYDDSLKYVNKFKNKKVDLVTADGGFDYSSDFNGQEINSIRIIYSEIVIALNILISKGNFIIKIFDIFSLNTVQLIKLLVHSFEKVYIHKPDTSRPANSEKYLVCINFKDNLSLDNKNHLLKLIKKWDDLNIDENDSILIKNLKVENKLIHQLNNFNELYMINQIHYLNKTIELIKNKPSKENYYKIIKDQVDTAIIWCKKYNTKINEDSIYYKKNYSLEI
tara:strand:- start:892 stop:2079 length:1188 start_codon:yes stop_codon:yes gene_type:complete